MVSAQRSSYQASTIIHNIVAKTTFSTHEAYSEMRAKVRLHPMGPHNFTFPLMGMEDGGLAIAFYTEILADIHYSMLMI